MTFSRSLRLIGLSLVSYSAVVAPLRAQQAPSGNNVGPQIQQSKILLTVVDKNLHFISTLRAEDLRLLENDKPREITSLSRLDDQPLTLAILIDTSPSQERPLREQKIVAAAFVQKIMRQGRDQAAVITFTGEVLLQQELTTDIDQVQGAIARVEFVPPLVSAGGGVAVVGQPPPPKDAALLASGTAVWDAIWAACDQQLSAPALAGTRKAIVLLSDGEDTASQVKMHEAIERAFTANVAVYSFGIGLQYSYNLNKGALRKLSEQTGGRAFFPANNVELEAALVEIQQELRYQYEITYRSDGKSDSSRKLRLEIINPSLRPKDLRISYQRITATK